jgi:hypothetical protein
LNGVIFRSITIEASQLEVLSADVQRNLAPHEGEAQAEFDKELAQLSQQSLLQVALLRLRGECQEIEVVGIFDELLCQIGLWRW